MTRYTHNTPVTEHRTHNIACNGTKYRVRITMNKAMNKKFLSVLNESERSLVMWKCGMRHEQRESNKKCGTERERDDGGARETTKARDG
jgi:hypothetical protein